MIELNEDLTIVIPKHNFMVMTNLDSNEESNVMNTVEYAWNKAAYPTLDTYLQWHKNPEFDINRPYYILISP